MMAGKEPFYFTDPDELVDYIIGKVGKGRHNQGNCMQGECAGDIEMFFP